MKRRTFLRTAGTAAATIPMVGCSAGFGLNRYRSKMPKGTVSMATLGKTGIKVSRLGFGSHLSSKLIAKPKYRDKMIKMGFEGGINTFDVYDHGGYNQFAPMGKSLRDFRKDAVISLCAVKNNEELQGEIDGALKTFYTDHIDLYRLYAVNDDRMDIMVKNKKAGKIRAIGVVSHDVKTMTKYIDDYQNELDFVMIIFNFHHNNGNYSKKDFIDNDYASLITRCEKLGLGILGIKPMGSDHMIALAKERGFFKNKDADPAQAMLRHVYQKSEIDCTMPAMNGMGELFKNLETAYDMQLSSNERQILKKLSETASSTKSAYLPRHYKWLENWHVS